MGLFVKNKVEADMEIKAIASKEKKVSVMELLRNDEAILESISVLSQKMDSMDKNNKKFLMAATMNDGRSEQLEQDIVNMKMGIIGLLDQIDVLLSAVLSSEAEDLKKGLNSYYNKNAKITSELGLEEIAFVNNMKFNSKEQECAEVVHLEKYEDDIVVALVQRGYRDKNNGKILRYAKVSVNRRLREED